MIFIDVAQMVIQLVAGVTGANAAALALKDKSLGRLRNSVAGVLGGALGAQLLNAMLNADMANFWDTGLIAQQVAGGGIGGAILLVAAASVWKG